MNYPTVIEIRHIKPQKRICCKCGTKIHGRGWHYITEIARGKYLCYGCSEKGLKSNDK